MTVRLSSTCRPLRLSFWNKFSKNGRPGLAVDGGHVGVSVAGGGTVRRDFIQTLEFVIAQLDAGGGDILLKIIQVFGAGDWHDVIALVQNPSQRQLSGL